MILLSGNPFCMPDGVDHDPVQLRVNGLFDANIEHATI
jgi:hypothetical protein